MAAGFDPKQTYSLWLDIHADVSAETRPVFVYRRISGREYAEIVKARNEHNAKLEAGDEAGDEIAQDHAYAALKIGLVDWKNHSNPETNEPVAFDPEKLAEVIDPVEAMELVAKRLYAARVSGKQLKNSE